jgi:MFS family permease
MARLQGKSPAAWPLLDKAEGEVYSNGQHRSPQKGGCALETSRRGTSPRIFYGWIIVAVSFVTLFLVVGTRFSLGIFYVAILEEYGWTRGETAGAFSTMMVVHAVFSLVVGLLFDWLGPRKLFPLGGLAIAIGFAACSQIRSIWQLYLFLGGIAAMGVSTLAFVPHMALVPNWFVRRRGTATGIVYAGIGTGQLALAPLIQSMVSSIGWRAAFLVLAALIALVVVPLTAIFQRRRPADLGLHPDGIPPAETRPIAADSHASRPCLPTRTAEKAEEWTVFQAMRTPQFWLLMVTGTGLGMNLNTLMVHQLAFLTDVGYSKLLGASLLGAVGGLRSLGGMSLGSLSDRVGRETAYSIGSVAAFLGVTLLISIHDTSQPWRLYLFVIMYGLGYGALGPVYAAATADLFPGRHLGTILGVLEAGYGMGGALGAYLAGYLFDVLGHYTLSFSIVLGAIALSCASLWLAAPRRVRAGQA